MENKIKETLNKEGTFDLVHYSDNINEQIVYIKSKIASAEKKITALNSKEAIISNIINRMSQEINTYIEKENKKVVDIVQGKILKFYETLGFINDTIIKYEDTIQKYIKMMIDIENHKVGAFTKIKAATKNANNDDSNYTELMEAITKLTSNNVEANTEMLEHVKNELKMEGF